MPNVPTKLPDGRAVAWPSTSVIRWMRARIVASGGDPNDIPDEPGALWRLDTVAARTGLSRATLYRMAARGEFPAPVRLSARSGERWPA